MKKDGHKTKNKFLRKMAKGNLLRRGLTTTKEYNSCSTPTLSASRLSSDGSVCSEGKDGTKDSTRHDSRTFLELIEQRCPSYSIVVNTLRGEMRLYVLALKELAEEISEVYTGGENTGIANVLANKGGIIATFNLRGTRLTFMTAHLEAHEGAAHYANRNRNLADILNGARTDPNYNLYDATIISHHIFVCGDLNYRIKYGDSRQRRGSSPQTITQKLVDNIKAVKVQDKTTPDKSNSAVSEESSPGPAPPKPSRADADADELGRDDLRKQEPSREGLEDSEERGSANGTHFAQAKAYVDAKYWKALNDGDELAMALEKKDCLVGFNTLPCNFPPTFKVERSKGYQYIKKRTPSYTDRILWKSASGMSGNVVPFLYEPCPDFITSDHKPIRGGYAVKMNKPRPGQQISSPFKDSDREVHLLVSDMKCTDLPIMDPEPGGLSDPYILFVSYPKSILWEKAWPSTNVIKRSLNPVWEQNIHLTLDGDKCQDKEGHVSFNGCMLYMTVMDEDFSSRDDMIGTVVLNLNELCSELATRKHDQYEVREVMISSPLLRDGGENGMLQCTITAAYLKEHEVKHFLARSEKKVRSKKKKRSKFLGFQMGYGGSGRAFQY